MLYYVRTGDISISTKANSPKEAAIFAIKHSEETPGVCVIVSEDKIIEEQSDSYTYFFTDSIIDEEARVSAPMRVVY